MQQPAATDDQQDEGAYQCQDFHPISASEIITAGPLSLLGNQWCNGLRDRLGGYIFHRCLRVLVSGYWMLDKGVVPGRWLLWRRRHDLFLFIESTEYLAYPGSSIQYSASWAIMVQRF